MAFLFVFKGWKNNYRMLNLLFLLDEAMLNFCSMEHREGAFCRDL